MANAIKTVLRVLETAAGEGTAHFGAMNAVALSESGVRMWRFIIRGRCHRRGGDLVLVAVRIESI